jgi:hypothetical protein
LLLAGCSPSADGALPADDERLIECALAGSQVFAKDCWVEQAGETLVVHHPDGAFRRFEWAGQALTTADGAQAAVVITANATLETRVGIDRYRFPLKTYGRP